MSDSPYVPKPPISTVSAYKKKQEEAEAEGKPKAKPRPEPPKPGLPPAPKKQIWFKCRVEGCPGTMAEMSEIVRPGGTLTRCKCLSCGRTFSFRR